MPHGFVKRMGLQWRLKLSITCSPLKKPMPYRADKPDRYQKMGLVNLSFSYNDLPCFGYLAGLIFRLNLMALTQKPQASVGCVPRTKFLEPNNRCVGRTLHSLFPLNPSRTDFYISKSMNYP
jgi:hypothetical protein